MCVKEITRALYTAGGSITTSKMVSLGSEMSITMHVECAPDRAYVAVVHAETLASHLRTAVCAVCVCVCT